mmetsp:Transcript_21030/g.62929  ORF Transcript_21030/g.62929 Transcript_21030/m.62929 type:complete len:464 (-) Transcript_21030:754-2145(-)
MQRPRRMLARRPAPKVVARDEDRRVPVALLVEHKVGTLAAVVEIAEAMKSSGAEAAALDGLQELLGDDHVGVNILDGQLCGHALQAREDLGGVACCSGAAACGRRAATALTCLDWRTLRPRARRVHLCDEAVKHRAVGRRQRRHIELAHVGETPRNGGRRCHCGGHEVRAATGALAALEVAVGRGRAALARLQLVGVHGQAHGAAGLAPVKARLDEDLVKALSLCLSLDQSRARHYHCVCVGRDLAALGDRRGGTNVLDARVGARTDEDLVDLEALQRGARGKAHVVEGACHRRSARRVGLAGRVWHHASDGAHVLRRRAPRDCRRNVLAAECDLLVILCIRVGRQLSPGVHRPVKQVALRGHGPSAQVVKGNLVRRDHAGARAALNRHVADRHARLHRQRRNCVARKLNHVACAAGGADGANDGEDDVLGGHARLQLARDRDAHVLSLGLYQRLRRQHVLHL